MKCGACHGRGFTELEHGLIMVECADCNGTGEIPDDSTSGAEPDNQSVRSADTSKPKRPRKPKAKKKAGKGTR